MRTPPKGENPFKIYGPDNTLLRTETPAVVAHHEQRRVFARTNERPGFIFFSAQNAYSLFDQHDPALAEDAITMELASWRWEEIRGLISGRVLLAHSSAGEWAVDGGADGAPMSAVGGFAARPRTERGTSWVEPLKVGDDDVLSSRRPATSCASSPTMGTGARTRKTASSATLTWRVAIRS